MTSPAFVDKKFQSTPVAGLATYGRGQSVDYSPIAPKRTAFGGKLQTETELLNQSHSTLNRTSSDGGLSSRTFDGSDVNGRLIGDPTRPTDRDIRSFSSGSSQSNPFSPLSQPLSQASSYSCGDSPAAASVVDVENLNNNNTGGFPFLQHLQEPNAPSHQFTGLSPEYTQDQERELACYQPQPPQYQQQYQPQSQSQQQQGIFQQTPLFRRQQHLLQQQQHQQQPWQQREQLLQQQQLHHQQQQQHHGGSDGSVYDVPVVQNANAVSVHTPSFDSEGNGGNGGHDQYLNLSQQDLTNLGNLVPPPPHPPAPAAAAAVPEAAGVPGADDPNRGWPSDPTRFSILVHRYD